MGPAALRLQSSGAEAPGLVVEFAQRTRSGLYRDNNEDAIGCWSHAEEFLFAVADGVGGYDRGEVASFTAIDTLAKTLADAPAGWRADRRLRHAVEQANLAVHDPTAAPMATTLTATLFGRSTLVTAHVGDCRLFRLRGGVLQQLTSDHNVAARLVSLGLLSAEDRPRHPGRRMVTRCLGQEPFIRVDLFTATLRPGDVYLQCSDGVANLAGAHISEILRGHDPETAATLLMERGLESAGGDDTSVQVALVVSCIEAPERRESFGWSRIAALLGWSL
ncbi:MAG TPA: PP2C family serine/threonine-protein phosphatase [Gemmatimonadales bacterium]|nr:PP2C family serine/threonine-protein phosphatase [Gemmatimonadales bacterium]